MLVMGMALTCLAITCPRHLQLSSSIPHARFTSLGSDSLSPLKLFLSLLALAKHSPPTSFTTSSSKFMAERMRLTRDQKPTEKFLPPWASGRHVCVFLLRTEQAACTLKIRHSSYNSGTSVRFIDWLGRQTRQWASAPNHFKLRKVTCNFISARESLTTFKDGERKLSSYQCVSDVLIDAFGN